MKGDAPLYLAATPGDTGLLSKTRYRNDVRQWTCLIQEDAWVTQTRHPTFRGVADCYRFHQTHRQPFLKYEHRFRQRGAAHTLVPPKGGTRSPFFPGSRLVVRL